VVALTAQDEKREREKLKYAFSRYQLPSSQHSSRHKIILSAPAHPHKFTFFLQDSVTGPADHDVSLGVYLGMCCREGAENFLVEEGEGGVELLDEDSYSSLQACNHGSEG
jgi:hypothetical protein